MNDYTGLNCRYHWYMV